jgi:hypothetical protein
VSEKELFEELKELATDGCATDKERENRLAEIFNPTWEMAFYYGDWGYLIPESIRESWDTLHPKDKISLFIVANRGASISRIARSHIEDD